MKNLIIIFALFPLLSFGQMDDKLKHKLVSHSIVHIGGYVMYKAINKVGVSIVVSSLTAYLIGYGKEKYDESQGREFSNEDMFANMNGIVIGALCLGVTIDLNKKKIRKREYLQQLKFK